QQTLQYVPAAQRRNPVPVPLARTQYIQGDHRLTSRQCPPQGGVTVTSQIVTEPDQTHGPPSPPPWSPTNRSSPRPLRRNRPGSASATPVCVTPRSEPARSTIARARNPACARATTGYSVVSRGAPRAPRASRPNGNGSTRPRAPRPPPAAPKSRPALRTKRPETPPAGDPPPPSPASRVDGDWERPPTVGRTISAAKSCQTGHGRQYVPAFADATATAHTSRSPPAPAGSHRSASGITVPAVAH